MQEKSDYIERNAVFTRFEVGQSWAILSPIEQSIKRKIEAVGKPLKEWDVRINYGIKTGFNEAFIIDGAKKDELIAQDPRSAEIIRPVLRGRDIKRYGYDFADKWLIATFPSRHYDINKYPAVKKYLLSFGMERLEQTGKTYFIDGKQVKARKKTNNKWFETQDSIGYWEDFNKQKIVWSDIANGINPFSYENNKLIILNTGYFLTSAHLVSNFIYFILALLNSKVSLFYMDKITNTLGNKGYRWIKEFIEILPLYPFRETVNIKEIIDLTFMRIGNSKYENKLEEKIYSLYNFDETEKAFLKFKF